MEEQKHGLERTFRRFVKYAYPEPNTGCWIWVGNLSRGYGSIYISQPYKKFIRAHRFSYLYFKGPIPNDLHVCHTCDNKWCVNPDHLWVGTRLENERDKKAKNRHKPRFRMYCRNGHLLQENLYIHNGKKKCRACEDQLYKLKQENKKLTEQVEKLKEDSNKDLFVLGSQLQEIERLRDERKEVEEQMLQLIHGCEIENESYHSSLHHGQMGMVSEEVTKTMVQMNNKTIRYLQSLLDKFNDSKS